MAKYLYETLGVSKGASPDEVRRAYRQAALKTHPDKQPQGISEKEKQRAREQFEQVANAYEVLSDKEKRRIYDIYGEFPPPEVQEDSYADFTDSRSRRRPPAHSHRHGGFRDPFSDPFFTQPFGPSPSRSGSRGDPFFSFTNPFALFEELFSDMRDQSEGPLSRDPSPSSGLFGWSPFGSGFPFGTTMGPSFGMLPPTNSIDQSGRPTHRQRVSFQNTSGGVFSRGPDGKPQWVSQSKMTTTINGVTESVWKRMDSNGNEHVTYSYPDGRERYLINGVEQSGRGERSLPPPPPYPGPPAPLNTSYRPNDRGSNRHDYSPTQARPPPGSHAEPTAMHGYDYGRDGDREHDRHHRHRERKHRYSRENYEAYAQQQQYGQQQQYDTQQPYGQQQQTSQPVRPDDHKKRWWKGDW